MRSMRCSSRFLRRAVAPAVVLTAAAAATLTLRAQDAARDPSPARAATGTTTQPVATQPASTQASSTRPASTQPDGAPKAAKEISLNFKDVPLDTVLDHLSAAAGYTVIKEGNVEGRVTVISRQPLTPEAAITLLSAVLKSNNFTAIQEGRVLKVMPRDKAKKGSIPVYYGSDPDLISPTDELITQVIQLRNIDAVKLLADIQPLRSPDADITATSASNAIIVTDSSSSIRRLARIIKMLDGQEASASDIRIRQLSFANATAAAKLLGEVFKGGGAAMSPQQMQMMQQQGMPVPPGGGGGREGFIPGGGIDKALRGGRVNASADERTNTIVITAPAETLTVIDNILDQLDANPAAGTGQIRIFPLNFAVAEDTAKLITSLFKGEEDSNNNDWWYFGPRRGGDDSALKVKVEAEFDERTNSVIVTAPEPTLKVIEGLIKDLDANPVTVTDLKVFHLENAKALDVSWLLEDIFKPKDDAGGGQDVIRYFYYDGGGAQSKKAPKMTAVSDDRTNSVIVTAPKEMMKAIEDVINQLDTNPVSEEDLFIYKLRNAQSANLEYVLNTLFGNYAQPGQNQDQQNQDQQNRQTGFGNNNLRNNNNRNNDRNRGNRNYNNRNRGNMPQMNQGLQRAAGELTGKVFVVADVDTNALLVTTASKYKEQVKKIIDELDRSVPQVLIKVLVAEIRHSDDLDYGVDFSILNRRPSGFGQVGGTNFGNAAAAGGLVVSVLEENVSATLRALAISGKLDVLSRPYILASDNQLATIQVGQDVPLIETSRFPDDGDQVNTFEYRSIGILLDVTPHINPDGQVILDVIPEISSLAESNILVQPGVTAPVINTRRAESRVEVMSGQTVVIGGLMEDKRESVIQKVPLLGDLPLIGEAFKRTRNNKVKTELLIFLTPHVAEETDALVPMSTDELQGTKLLPNAGEPGMFQEHMRNMRRGAVPLTQPSGNGGPYVPTSPPTSRPMSPTTRPASDAPDAPAPRPGIEIGVPAEPAPAPAPAATQSTARGSAD